MQTHVNASISQLIFKLSFNECLRIHLILVAILFFASVAIFQKKEVFYNCCPIYIYCSQCLLDYTQLLLKENADTVL
jgi:hypothetical protein